jgi:DNA-binding beta-propeller fold protein YncE
VVVLLGTLPAVAGGQALELVQTIPLHGRVGQRLDHMALDARRDRLLVANMGNGTLDVVDLKAGKLLREVPGQRGIQGVAYAPDLDRVYVGLGDGGVCNVFDGESYKLLKSVPFPDADNVRYDPRTRRVYVAHAPSRLEVLDAQTFKVLADVKLPAAVEAFQLEKSRPRLYANVPAARQVVVVDTKTNKVLNRYPLRQAGANYPMALDEAGHRLFIGCRKPSRVVVLDTESGREVAGVPIPGDVDDLFLDARLGRVYASCGAGALAVLRLVGGDRYELLEKVPTGKLARTSFFDPAGGRLFLALPRTGGGPPEGRGGPEVRVYRARPGAQR